MRIIITGGTGFVGTGLTEHLLQSGHEVIILSRNPERKPVKVSPLLRIEKWDGLSAAGWGHLADGADAIVNLAGANIGESRWSPTRKKEIIASRVNAGKAVVEAVKRAVQKPALVIQASGVDFYGVQGAEKIDETWPAGKGFLSEICRQWEAAAQSVEDYGVRRVITRGAVVLSRNGGAFPRILQPFKFWVGGSLGSGQQWFSWIHIADQVSGLVWLLNNPEAQGVYNFSAPQPVQNRELARTIGRIMQRPAFFAVPAFLIRMLFGEMAITVLGGQRVIPDRLQREGFDFRYPDIESAVRSIVGKAVS